MSALTRDLALDLGWSAEDAEHLRVASALHDIGKVAIPDRILRKRGALTAAERERIEEHPQIGRSILEGSHNDVLRLAETIAWAHHERIDGSGYPRRLEGDEIPAAARLAAVADVYDALTSDRPYRRALDADAALAVIQSDRGLDRDVVGALVRLTRKRAAGSRAS